MILKDLLTYIESKQRVAEVDLLKHFHLHRKGLGPMIEILIKTGHIQKTVNNRGTALPVQIFYSWQPVKVIPMVTLL